MLPGDPIDIPCPKCKGQLVYNGNYFCTECKWQLPDRANSKIYLEGLIRYRRSKGRDTTREERYL
jgi:hypothetical protein